MQSGKQKFIEQAQDFADDVRSATSEALNEAKEKAGPAIAETREKAAPFIAEAKEKAAPIVAEAKDRAADAREASVAKVAELRGVEPEPKKGSWIKRILIVSGLAGVGVLVYKKIQGKQEVNWQSSYQPVPTHKPAAPAPSSPAAGTTPASGVGADSSAAAEGEDVEKKDDAGAPDASPEQKPPGGVS